LAGRRTARVARRAARPAAFTALPIPEWWAHFEFTRMNIEPIILRKSIEDLREAGASKSVARRSNREGDVRLVNAPGREFYKVGSVALLAGTG